MTRLRAFAIHLTTSVTIFLIFLGIMFFVWYPAPYFVIDGGWKVLRILAGANLVLGPLLTLIVFKPGKPSLKFDLSCIVLLQLGALLYGGTVIYQQRPAFVVFGVDRFTSIPAAEVEFDQLKYPELQRVVGIGPLLAQTRPPDDPKLRQELLFAVVLEGQKDLEFRAEFYEPYRPDLAQLRARSIDLAKIAARDETAKAAIETFASHHNGRLEDYFYLPLRGKNQDIVLALSATDGMPAGWIPISPWLEDDRKLQAFSENERAYHAYQARQNYLREQRSLQRYLETLQAQTETLQAQAERERAAKEQERAAKEAERVSREVLSLPVHPFLEEREQDRVVAAVLAAVG